MRMKFCERENRMVQDQSTEVNATAALIVLDNGASGYPVLDFAG